MPTDLLKPLDEAFAAAVARGDRLVDAYARTRAVKPDARRRTHLTKASELAARPDIAARIAELRAVAAVEAQFGVTETLRELAALVRADVRDLFDENGNLLPVDQFPDATARAIASLEVVTRKVPGSDPVEVEYVTKIKLHDKNAAIDKAMKHLGLYERDNRQNPERDPPVVQILVNGVPAPPRAD